MKSEDIRTINNKISQLFTGICVCFVFDLQKVLIKLFSTSFSNMPSHAQRRWKLMELAGCTDSRKSCMQRVLEIRYIHFIFLNTFQSPCIFPMYSIYCRITPSCNIISRTPDNFTHTYIHFQYFFHKINRIHTSVHNCDFSNEQL